jgi:hypothetical protein
MRGLIWLIVSASIPGCRAAQPVELVLQTELAVRVDGILDDPCWRVAPTHRLVMPGGRTTIEHATVQFAFDDEHLYLAVRSDDRDVVQELERDQQHHYTAGDVVELFIKPLGHPAYWEFFVTPGGWKTAQFFPSRGRLGLPSSMAYVSGLQGAAKTDGTLNDPSDDDRGWSAELAVPLAEIERQAGASPELTVLVGRYNYGRHLDRKELSSWPGLPLADFHDHAQYRLLQLGGGHSTREVQK